MKVKLKECGYVIEELSLSNLRKYHFMGDNSVSFRNFNNMIVNIDIQDKIYVLRCDNGIKNYKTTLEGVKDYIKRNAMK